MRAAGEGVSKCEGPSIIPALDQRFGGILTLTMKGLAPIHLGLAIAFGLTLSAVAFTAHSRQGSVLSLLPRSQITPSSKDVKVDPTSGSGASGYSLSISPGSDSYPGVNFKPLTAVWNLSAYGHVDARIWNSGSKPIYVSLRVDNGGNWQDNPWNAEGALIQPGQHGVIRTIFGYSYGFKKGFALDSSKVVNFVVFASKSDAPQSLRIESLEAAGKPDEQPPVSPDDVRVKPIGGVIFDVANSAPEAKIWTQGEIEANSGTSVPAASFPISQNPGILRISPRLGRWDLSSQTQVIVSLRNQGGVSVRPRLRIESNGGNSDWMVVEKQLAPGATHDYVVPFSHHVDLNQTPLTGLITSDAVSAIAVSVTPSDQPRQLEIRLIKATVKAAILPTWLGKRPPVPGDWVQTLDDEFDGNVLNKTIWKSTGENYYDKLSHWSARNVLIGNGLARLRYEKKTGYQNDDPKLTSTPYASGYLDSYGIWTQKYGYFESRMKVPTAPGLWPAFWMMPDRGLKAGPEQWKRQDTANGGMEFDIMEHLTRWGPYRFNIAMHYDGYEKDHKQIGSDKIYAEPDKDGYVTCGLLWTPGLLAYYFNGHEVLRWQNPRVSTVQADLMFTMPMGGWDNNALDDSQLPADFVIDYVRIWQRKDLNSASK